MNDFVATDFSAANSSRSRAATASIHVIGFGKETGSVIGQLSRYGYDEVLPYMAESVESTQPGDTCVMAILCVDDNEDKALQVSKSFYDANVLTLIVSTKSLPGNDFDSITKVSLEEMPAAIKGLLDPIFLHRQTNLDFNDMSTCLRNSGHFLIWEAIGKGKESRIGDALTKLRTANSDGRLDYAEYVALIIYYHPDIDPPLMMREIARLNEYLSLMPKEINVIWGIFRDDNMPTDEIRLSAIISGKELRL